MVKEQKSRRRGRFPPQKMRALPGCIQPLGASGEADAEQREPRVGGSATEPCTCPALTQGGCPLLSLGGGRLWCFLPGGKPQGHRGPLVQTRPQCRLPKSSHSGPPCNRVKQITTTALAAATDGVLTLCWALCPNSIQSPRRALKSLRLLQPERDRT